jgi:hypothetical protein
MNKINRGRDKPHNLWIVSISNCFNLTSVVQFICIINGTWFMSDTIREQVIERQDLSARLERFQEGLNFIWDRISERTYRVQALGEITLALGASAFGGMLVSADSASAQSYVKARAAGTSFTFKPINNWDIAECQGEMMGTLGTKGFNNSSRKDMNPGFIFRQRDTFHRNSKKASVKLGLNAMRVYYLPGFPLWASRDCATVTNNHVEVQAVKKQGKKSIPVSKMKTVSIGEGDHNGRIINKTVHLNLKNKLTGKDLKKRRIGIQTTVISEPVAAVEMSKEQYDALYCPPDAPPSFDDPYRCEADNYPDNSTFAPVNMVKISWIKFKETRKK